MELVVRLVDLVHRQLLGPELRRLLVQPVELAVGDQQARALRDLRLEAAAQPVDALQLAEVERGDGGAAALGATGPGPGFPGCAAPRAPG